MNAHPHLGHPHLSHPHLGHPPDPTLRSRPRTATTLAWTANAGALLANVIAVVCTGYAALGSLEQAVVSHSAAPGPGGDARCALFSVVAAVVALALLVAATVLIVVAMTDRPPARGNSRQPGSTELAVAITLTAFNTVIAYVTGVAGWLLLTSLAI